MRLKPSQETAIKFLTEGGPHKLLLDDPGVGKTAPVCVAFTKIDQLRPILIITLPGQKTDWEWNLREWGAAHSKLDTQIINTGKDKIDKRRSFIIISPQLLLNKNIQLQLLTMQFDCIAVDEAHVFKSWDAVGSKFLHQHLLKRGDKIWFITGSFMPNKPIEMYLPLKCLFPELLGEYVDYEKFTRRYCAGFMDSQGWNANGSSHLDELRARISPAVLRRELREVYPRLPLCTFREIYVTADIEESERDTPTTTLERLVGIAKIPGAVAFITDWLYNEPNKKLLVFTRNRQVTEEIQAQIPGALKYYGGMSKEAKQNAKMAFINDPKARVLVANRQSIGQATDGLQHVCHHILEVQLDWSRGLQDQGYGRIVRNGQTETQYVTRLIAEDTVEEAHVRVYRQKATINTQLFGRKIVSLEDKLDRIIELLEAAKDSPKPSATNAPTAEKPLGKSASTASKGSTGKPGRLHKAKPEPEAEDEADEDEPENTEPTIDDVRAVAGEVRQKLGGKAVPASKAAIDKVTQSFKAKDGGKCKVLADIQEKDYAKVIARFEALAPKEEEPEEDDEDEDEE
jgi:SNF2-related domain